MPENETLLYDARSASRWQPISNKLDHGLSAIDAFPAIQNAFYGLFQSVWKQWLRCNVDPAELFRAALDDPIQLGELIRQTRNNPNALLLRDVAESLDDTDMDRLIGAFLEAVWDSVRSQILLDCRKEGQSDEFMNQIQGMLDRIRGCLLNNLSQFPSRIRRESPPDIGTRLGENLL